MAPKVKLGKFAKRNQAMRKRVQILPGGKVPTKKEALDMAKMVAGGLAKYPVQKPTIAVLMPRVTVKR